MRCRKTITKFGKFEVITIGENKNIHCRFFNIFLFYSLISTLEHCIDLLFCHYVSRSTA